jgi:cell division protein FtsI/penicillin-binding protein 2
MIRLGGLEAKLDTLLKGNRKKQNIYTDNQRPIFQSVFSLKTTGRRPKVLLTIDHNIQFYLEQSLDKALAPPIGCSHSIVMDPKTAMCWPWSAAYEQSQTILEGGPGECAIGLLPTY